MRRAWIWGLLLLVLACAEKAPPEGAVRISVQYKSYQPACVLVVARDEAGEKGRMDIPRARLMNAEAQVIRAAVFRDADWGRTLGVEVSSFTGFDGEKCSGTQVETVSQQVEVPLGGYATFAAEFLATDEDGDDSPALVGSVKGLDCDDSRKDVYPGAEERCSVAVDYDCDGARGCQDGKCQQKACDDGNACTSGDRCVGSGTTAQCQGQAKVCETPAGLCFTGATCARDTGECVPVRKQCPVSAAVCLESAGTCNDTTGNCEYLAKSTSVSCDDSQVCTVDDTCDGRGNCRGTQRTCPVSSVCFRATGTCPAAGTCGEEPDPAKVDAACSLPNESLGGRCRATSGKCSRFPYAPSHFDPDAIASARIVNLTTTCEVTFDSTALSWTPPACVTESPMPIELTQENGAVLLPILNLSLGGTLKLVGNRPVILAVYDNATFNQDVLANGTGTTVPGAGGSMAQACEIRRGRGGVVASPGGGGGGAGGGLVGAKGGRGAPAGSSPGDGGGAETVLAGGCSGGGGGGDPEGGKGGVGGGMVQVSVARTLTVNKTISVSGGGGGGGGASTNGEAGGGGGGGSGGRILLEAQQVTLANAARLMANGGGGGEGGAYRSTEQARGNNGADGSVLYEAPATGGNGASNTGGDGGNGGARDRAAEVGKDSTPASNAKGGGGGGGGSVGVIRLRSLNPCVHNNAVTSPNIDRMCPM